MDSPFMKSDDCRHLLSFHVINMYKNVYTGLYTRLDRGGTHKHKEVKERPIFLSFVPENELMVTSLPGVCVSPDTKQVCIAHHEDKKRE